MAFAVKLIKSNTDSRTYAERMFYNFKDGQKVAREVLIVNCDKETPKDYEIPDGLIVVMKNYKGSNARGRKNSLQGETLVFIPSDKGKIVLPLNQMAEFRELTVKLETALNASSEITGE